MNTRLRLRVVTIAAIRTGEQYEATRLIWEDICCLVSHYQEEIREPSFGDEGELLDDEHDYVRIPLTTQDADSDLAPGFTRVSDVHVADATGEQYLIVTNRDILESIAEKFSGGACVEDESARIDEASIKLDDDRSGGTMDLWYTSSSSAECDESGEFDWHFQNQLLLFKIDFEQANLVVTNVPDVALECGGVSQDEYEESLDEDFQDEDD